MWPRAFEAARSRGPRGPSPHDRRLYQRSPHQEQSRHPGQSLDVMLLQRNIGLQMEFELIECGSSQIVRNILLLKLMQFIHTFNVSVQIVFNVHAGIIPSPEICYKKFRPKEKYYCSELFARICSEFKVLQQRNAIPINAQSIFREFGQAVTPCQRNHFCPFPKGNVNLMDPKSIRECHDPNKFDFSLDRREAFRFVPQTHLTMNLMIVLFSIEPAARPWPQARVGSIQQRFVGAPRPGARPDHRPLNVGCLLQCSGVSRIEPFVSDTQRST